MIPQRIYRAMSLIGILAALGTGCGRDIADPRSPYFGPIDPTNQPDELTRALGVSGTNVEGELPPASLGTVPQFVSTQSSASVTADNTLYLPFAYTSVVPIAGMQISVEGAANYWEVELPDAGTSGSRVVPIGIPPDVLPGDFRLNYQLFDVSGQVGNATGMSTSVVPPTAGTGGPITFPIVEGTDGLTVRTYALGANSGTVSIQWETYTVPDRVDIRSGGQWVESTGTLLDVLGAPPILDCSAAESADGFVGSSGTFSFELDPSRRGNVDVYVSGCMNGGTAWWFQVSFTPTIVATSTLPDCPCTLGEVRFGETRDANGKVTGEWRDGTYPTVAWFHPGASYDIRWAPSNPVDPRGQQCTYDVQGKLITSGIGAGTRDKVSPYVDWAGHEAADVAPWAIVTCDQYYAGWPTNDGDGCPTNAKTPFAHMARMTKGMPCPEIMGLVDFVRQSVFATPTLRDYVSGTLGYSPDEATLRTDLHTIIENERGDYERLLPVDHAYRNLGGPPGSELRGPLASQVGEGHSAEATSPYLHDAIREFRSEGGQR